MSQISHPVVSLPTSQRSTRTALLGALLALLAGAAIVLVLTLDGDSSSTSSSVIDQSQPAVRSDGGPNESAIAASIGTRPSVGPNEAGTAAAIGASTVRPESGPDESRSAAAVSQSAPASPVHAGSDEGRIGPSTGTGSGGPDVSHTSGR